MSNKYDHVVSGDQIIYTENGRALKVHEVIERLEAGLYAEDPRERLHGALRQLAEQGVIVSRVLAEYVQMDGGRALLVEVETEESRLVR